jgi:hypothetical protein
MAVKGKNKIFLDWGLALRTGMRWTHTNDPTPYQTNSGPSLEVNALAVRVFKQEAYQP